MTLYYYKLRPLLAFEIILLIPLIYKTNTIFCAPSINKEEIQEKNNLNNTGNIITPSPSPLNADEDEGVGENVLIKHISFFDRNKDGIIYPWETYEGFRAIGVDISKSTILGFLTNMALTRETRPGKYPSLLMPIEVKNIARAKHGSDTGVYDTEGRFVPSKFENIFIKHAHTHANALTAEEVNEMLKANREPKDYNGWYSAYMEWTIFYELGKDKDGLLQRDTIQSLYDGSLFEKLERETQSKKHD